MATTHLDYYNYTDWTNRFSYYGQDDTYVIQILSSGTSSKVSQLYDISRVQKLSNMKVTGGYGWITTMTSGSGGSIVGNSLYTTLTVTVHLVAADGVTKTLIGSATGSATRGGNLNLYDHSTTGTISDYIITDADRQNYKYVQITYGCSTSSSSVSLKKAYAGTYEDKGTGNPTGTVTLTMIDHLNTKLDGTYVFDMTMDGTTIEAMNYDEESIF